jgi:hypothetical protein
MKPKRESMPASAIEKWSLGHQKKGNAQQGIHLLCEEVQGYDPDIDACEVFHDVIYF